MPSAHSEVAALSPSGLRSNPARGCPAPSPDARGCPRGIRSLDADRAAPSWLRLSAHAGSQGTGSPGPAVCLSRRRSRQSVCSGLRSPGKARLRARGRRTVAGAPACAPAYGRRAKPGSAHAVVAPWQRRRHLLRLMLAKQTPGSMQAMRAPWRLHSQSLRVAARRRSAAAAVARMCDRSAFEPHLGCGSECPSENRQDAGVSRVFSRASRPLRAVRGCRCR